LEVLRVAVRRQLQPRPAWDSAQQQEQAVVVVLQLGVEVI
jgi:hypothetical protein